DGYHGNLCYPKVKEVWGYICWYLAYDGVCEGKREILQGRKIRCESGGSEDG
ncbi:hypothetical protein Ancab_010628, partial [Ancistrocladus abbreviatus]